MDAPPPEYPSRCLVLLVGIPGSGKSTYLERRGLRAVSTDEIRMLLFDNEEEQRYQQWVFSLLRHVVRARLSSGVPRTFVDATNLTPHDRKPLLAIASELNYPTFALYFDTPLETCMKRNQARGRKVPEDVMLRMAQKLRPPTPAEGFERVDRVSGNQGKATAFFGTQ